MFGRRRAPGAASTKTQAFWPFCFEVTSIPDFAFGEGGRVGGAAVGDGAFERGGEIVAILDGDVDRGGARILKQVDVAHHAVLFEQADAPSDLEPHDRLLAGQDKLLAVRGHHRLVVVKLLATDMQHEDVVEEAVAGVLEEAVVVQAPLVALVVGLRLHVGGDQGFRAGRICGGTAVEALATSAERARAVSRASSVARLRGTRRWTGGRPQRAAQWSLKWWAIIGPPRLGLLPSEEMTLGYRPHGAAAHLEGDAPPCNVPSNEAPLERVTAKTGSGSLRLRPVPRCRVRTF